MQQEKASVFFLVASIVAMDTAKVMMPGATSVVLSFASYGRVYPVLHMTQTGNGTWSFTFPIAFIVASGAKSVDITATGTLGCGGTISHTATLWLGSKPVPPAPCPFTGQLALWSDDTQAYGLAEGSFDLLNQGLIPLNANLRVKHDLNLWLDVEDVECSGDASFDLPTGYSVAELLGRAWLVNPQGTIAHVGHFTKVGDGDTVTIKLGPGVRAAPINIAMILLNLVPGANAANPSDVLHVLDDLDKLNSVKDAAKELFSGEDRDAWGWMKSVGKAAWSLKWVIKDESQKKALSAILTKLARRAVTEGEVKMVADGLGSLDLLKVIGSEIIWFAQTKGDTLCGAFLSIVVSCCGYSSDCSHATFCLTGPLKNESLNVIFRTSPETYW